MSFGEPILQAGPWATSSAAHLDADADDAAPVNRLNKAHADWPFTFIRKVEDAFGHDPSTSSHTNAGIAFINSSSFNNAGESQAEIVFAYQAAQPWTFGSSADDAIIWTVMADSGSSGDDLSVSAEHEVYLTEFDGSETLIKSASASAQNTIEGETVIGFNLNLLTEIGDLEFPAAAKPATVRIVARATKSGDGGMLYLDANQVEFPITVDP